MDDLNISFGTTGDALVEGPERLRVDVSNPASTTGATATITASSSVTTTIVDDESLPLEHQRAGFRDEGSTAQYTVALSGTYGGGEVVTVDLDLTDIDTNSSDYGDLLAAITTAAATNPDLTFNPATGTLTYTSPSDGATLTPLVFDCQSPRTVSPKETKTFR